jgi:predicted RNase H-like nuclease (RuvC/YqgF family)
MGELGRKLLVISAIVSLSLHARGQDGQSLGDVARQTRQQNQKKDAPDGQAPKTTKVFNNDEMPASGRDSGESTARDPRRPSNTSTRASTVKPSAEQWRSRILALKNAINAAQSEIERVTASIHSASPGCTQNCVTGDERVLEKLLKVDQMRTQLENQKQRLQGMQESARRQGYGNAVYDP